MRMITITRLYLDGSGAYYRHQPRKAETLTNLKMPTLLYNWALPRLILIPRGIVGCSHLPTIAYGVNIQEPSPTGTDVQIWLPVQRINSGLWPSRHSLSIC